MEKIIKNIKLSTIGEVPQKTFNHIFNLIYCLDMNIEQEVFICEQSHKIEFHKEYMKTPWLGNYGYRAITFGNLKKTFVFLNDGETIDSILWVVVHELTHANLRDNPFMRKVLNMNLTKTMHDMNINPNEYEKLIQNDEFHEKLLEEQICNEFATNVMGFSYDRYWWREQLKLIA